MVTSGNVPSPREPQITRPLPVITSLGTAGFKVFSERTDIEIGNLTLLAGANSSGKSSIMQPVLLLKQTLESPESGAHIFLAGPNVVVTDKKQILTRNMTQEDQNLQIGITINGDIVLNQEYSFENGKSLALIKSTFDSPLNSYKRLILSPEMTSAEIGDQIGVMPVASFKRHVGEGLKLSIEIIRGFMAVVGSKTPENFSDAFDATIQLQSSPTIRVERAIKHIIHVPGLRMNPSRKYSMLSSPGLPIFPVTMDSYVAWLLKEWQDDDEDKLLDLEKLLLRLGLTSRIRTKMVDETTVDIEVGRSLSFDSELVSIADVGIGVSQVLPILMALLVAVPNQLVYIEQPEVHLHPRAQVELAKAICDTARRGVRVVVETHSELMLMTIQSYIANGQLDRADVKLHWFSRDMATGDVSVNTAELGTDGSFGPWPEDFSSISMQAQMDYLDSITGSK